MKIYLLLEKWNDGELCGIDGVYSTKEKAEKALKLITDNMAELVVDEWEVDV